MRVDLEPLHHHNTQARAGVMAPSNEMAVVLAKLEELGKKADEANSKADQTNRKIEEMQQSINLLSEEQTSVKNWKPELEGRVTELQNSVFDLKTKVDLFIHEPPKPNSKAEGEVKMEAPTPAHLGVAATVEASRQIGHHYANHHRGVSAGVVTTLVPPPVKGADLFHNSPRTPHAGFSTPVHFGSAVPHLEFPKFDGTNPKIWIRRCETYFDICDVPVALWVKLATMNFSATAAFWMQSIEVNLKEVSWNELCQAIVDRFERDQHNHLVRQFLHIKQANSVAEYVELFDELVHRLLAHDIYVNPVVITSNFFDGLKLEIKSVVLVHRPKDLDTASSLALLQEEVLLGQLSRDWKRYDEFAYGKQVQKNSNVTIAPRTSTPVNEKLAVEGRKYNGSPKNKPQDEKLAALMAYRKEKGLCYKCGMKWGPTHNCPENVPLHMVEELWQLLSDKEASAIPVNEKLGYDSGEDLMSISDQATSGTSTGKTIRLSGHIEQHKAIMLIDSGSSHSFISEQFAALLPNWTALEEPVRVKVANGGVLLCTHEVVNC